jgi:small subunit ribosomal protein S16
MIKIRMAKGGRKHAPIFTIVAIESRNARDGRCIERLGKYEPQKTEPLSNVNIESLKTWVKNGAQMSDTVATLLKRQNIKL